MKKPSQTKQTNKKKKSHIPFRLNLLFFIVFALFSALIIRLGYLQIVKGEEFVAEVGRTETTVATENVPRGEIFDSQYRKIVANEPHQAIIYTRGKGVPGDVMAETAMKLAELIDMPHTVRWTTDIKEYDISVRDLKDYWLALHAEEASDRLSDKEKELTGSELYLTQVDKVTEEDIKFEPVEEAAAAIFKRMNGAYALSTVNIKKTDVTDEEIARVSERLNELPGIDTSTDWVRTYPQEDMLRTILGNVTDEDSGIPADKEKTYLANGYARNDRVGSSYLEEQYETVLRGSKAKAYTETNNDGDVINQVEQFSGEKGANLVLSIDSKFQATVQDIAKDSLLQYREGDNDRIYVAAMDPQSGEVLAMTGQRYDKENNEIVDQTRGVIQDSFEMGSTVKGATLLTAYMDGVLTSSNNVLVDRPLDLAGDKDISSLFNPYGSVTIDDIIALERSSNVYMALMAARMGGISNFQPNQSFPNNFHKVVLDKFRRSFAQFGLGVQTGIDLPGEKTGYVGNATNPGEALYFSFGQYDTYTTMQLLQHISTIANDGVRIAPRVVKEIRSTAPDGEIGALLTETDKEVLSTLSVEKEDLERVQKGLYEVVHGSNGTARSAFVGASYDAAAKTGTAQAAYQGKSVTNKTFVAYAPYDDPEIAITVVVPWLPNSNSNYQNTAVARQVLDAYFKEGEYAEDSIVIEEVTQEEDLEDQESNE
ncbi:peptidoglycan D,D-transpeptidase FtsI family protein [Lacticigenium naphthae]|uniref:peptidoglycan D,D-transpeptidase FtsI family protein n=1 Tax=Lacticigenium naphthae TaxID=515351 RepID=UPI0003F6FE7F|nr:penicillin-binding protein 2 [Lacticigenium naphthae]